MSWWTSVDLGYLDTSNGDVAPEFDAESIQPELESVVDKIEFHRDVAQDMSELISQKHAAFKLNSFAVMHVFAGLAAKFPLVSFWIRGRGEDARDIWIREYSEGKESYAFGPPEDFEY